MSWRRGSRAKHPNHGEGLRWVEADTSAQRTRERKAVSCTECAAGRLQEYNMKRLAISAMAAASLSLAGCATTAQSHRTGTAVAGAGIGGAAGAIAGSVLPGIGTAAGAVAGATLGGIVGNVIGGRQYYRDTQGYCYYVDQNGRPVYNRNVRC